MPKDNPQKRLQEMWDRKKAQNPDQNKNPHGIDTAGVKPEARKPKT